MVFKKTPQQPFGKSLTDFGKILKAKAVLGDGRSIVYARTLTKRFNSQVFSRPNCNYPSKFKDSRKLET